MNLKISLEENFDESESADIQNRINADVEAKGIKRNFRSFCLMVRDENGALRGCVQARTAYTWLCIQKLWMDPEIRGQGFAKKLVLEAERIALERGCHSAHVDTLSCQAPEFYQKLGYEIFAELDNYSAGNKRCFLKKEDLASSIAE